MKGFAIFLSCMIEMSVVPVISRATIVHVPDDYESIQEAIVASTDGDTFLVEEGTYVELIDFLRKSVFLTSTYTFDSDTMSIV